MDCDDFSENKCFTFTWNIENYNYSWQKNVEYISSPVFIVDTMGKSRWTLQLYPKGCREDTKDFISFFLKRESACSGPEQLDMQFDLSFLATDNSVLTSKGPYKNSFLKNRNWGYGKFVKREEVLKIKKKDYLPANVLTVRCRMWYSNEAKHYGHYFARTRIAVERRSFVWNIEQFSSFQESICEIASSSAEQSIITLKFFPSCGQNSKIFIRVEVCHHDPQLKNLTFRIYLMDTSGNRTKCLNDEIAFDADIKTTSFSLTFSKEELMKNKSCYLPNDVLQLYCECDIATGIVLEETEKISYGCPLSIQVGNLTCNDTKSEKMFLEAAKILIGNLESLYKENSLCDTKLKTKTSSFPTHKFILGARSPVFKAMFTNDMRERNSECVDIEDLDDATIQTMLLYMYTTELQDLEWNRACNLYAAADKYEILNLKNECSSFLKDNLSVDNACDLLILADRHQDEDLKSIVQDYILNHKNIFHSIEWKHFMKTNVQLAADLMYLKCKE